MNQKDPTEPESSQLPAPARDQYAYTVEESVLYFLDHGYRIAPRTVSWHCQTELLDCKKFASGSALKWKITKKSLDERIKTLEREGSATARNSQQLPAGMPAGNSEQLPEIAGTYEAELIELLKGELKDKNKQIDEFQSIIREHNKQFENLNETIQLSNQTIQQLNRTLALPQVKDVIGAMHRDDHDVSVTHDYRDHEPGTLTSKSEGAAFAKALAQASSRKQRCTSPNDSKRSAKPQSTE